MLFQKIVLVVYHIRPPDFGVTKIDFWNTVICDMTVCFV